MYKKIWLIVLIIILVSIGIYFYNSQSIEIEFEPPQYTRAECIANHAACRLNEEQAHQECLEEGSPTYLDLIDEYCPEPVTDKCRDDMYELLPFRCQEISEETIAECNRILRQCILAAEVLEDAKKRKSLRGDSGW